MSRFSLRELQRKKERIFQRIDDNFLPLTGKTFTINVAEAREIFFECDTFLVEHNGNWDFSLLHDNSRIRMNRGGIPTQRSDMWLKSIDTIHSGNIYLFFRTDGTAPSNKPCHRIYLAFYSLGYRGTIPEDMEIIPPHEPSIRERNCERRFSRTALLYSTPRASPASADSQLKITDAVPHQDDEAEGYYEP